MTMTTFRRRRLEDLQLRDLAPRPPQGSVEAVKPLTPYSRRAPDQSSEDELRPDFLVLIHEKQGAESPFRMHLYGMRFVDERTRKRPWPVFDRVRPRPPHKLPVVLSPRAVRTLLALVVNPTARMGLPWIDACGRRRREGTPVQVADLDAQRLLGRGRQGTGGKDRFGPLAPRGLEVWRASWQRRRPRPWWFPARHRQTPLPATTLQKTCKLGVRRRGLPKEASIHPLRHS
jgi:integrase/recombinase XerD